MATHNNMDLIGYLTEEPEIIREKSLVVFTVRTARRIIDSYKNTSRFEDLLVYCDDLKLFGVLSKLHLYDLIRIKGVVSILSITKRYPECPHCRYEKNRKENASSLVVYPIFVDKMGSIKTEMDSNIFLPDKLLNEKYAEVSNLATFIGTVVNEPELLHIGGEWFCKFQIGVDRKYYIKSQPELMADYPWVYSYGGEGKDNYKHLKVGSLILIYGFLHNEAIRPKVTCECCGRTYSYDDGRNEIIPYSIEYLNGYLTDKDLAELKEKGEENDGSEV